MKKRIIFLTTFCFLLLTDVRLLSQVSFLEPDTAVWRFRGWVHFGPCFFYDWQLMLSRQDTIVGDHTYRKVFRLNRNAVYSPCIEPPLGSTSPSPPIPTLHGLIREEGRKVYYWRTGEDSELLYYDFGQQVGDTVPIYANQGIQIYSITDTILNGRVFKKFTLGTSGAHNWDIIEGIGANKHPFLAFLDYGTTVWLECYSRNDSTYYQLNEICGYFPYPIVTNTNEALSEEAQTEKRIWIYPNPASNQVNIVFHFEGDYSVDLVDQMGQKLNVETVQRIKEIVLDINSLSDGVYMLLVKENEILVSVEKIIVLH